MGLGSACQGMDVQGHETREWVRVKGRLPLCWKGGPMLVELLVKCYTSDTKRPELNL